MAFNIAAESRSKVSIKTFRTKLIDNITYQKYNWLIINPMIWGKRKNFYGQFDTSPHPHMVRSGFSLAVKYL